MWRSAIRRTTSRRVSLLSVAFWIAIPIALMSASLGGFTPSLSDVSSSKQGDFLPVGAESRDALKLQERYFPTNGVPGILVYHRSTGLTVDDLHSIKQDYIWLKERSRDNVILSEVSSFFDNPMLRNAVLSKDQSTALIFLTMIGSDLVDVEELQTEVRAIRGQIVSGRSDGLETWFTGPAGVLEDAVSVFQSIDFRITLVSVLLVLVILLIVYKLSLVLALLPILSAGLAYITASNMVAILADLFGMIVNAQATSIMVVLIFGAGTDYMLFISARFREQLKLGKPVRIGMEETMNRVGPAILSSAATTILAMIALGLATLRSYQILGPILAIGMCCAILAGLTFIPAVLRLLGHRAYWPSKVSKEEVDGPGRNELRGFWGKLGTYISKRPLFTAGSSIIVLFIMGLGVFRIEPSYDLLDSLPEGSESVKGFHVVEEFFPSGTGDPTNVFLLTSQEPILHFDEIERLTERLSSINSVSVVNGPTRPFGMTVSDLAQDYGDALSGLSGTDRAMIWEEGINSVPTLLETGNVQVSGSYAVETIVASHNYLSPHGDVARLEIIFKDDPGAKETLAQIDVVRAISGQHLNVGINEIIVGGKTALQHDTKAASDRDILVIAPVVMAIIFVVLAILVRAIIAPLYLLGSVLLSFFASLGISILFFEFILGHDGIGSGVPIFMFIFLVALGVDYNIYIISRIKEESRNLDIRDATIKSISQTGGVISSAGVILAGTFLALTTLPLRDLFQLGFVVSLGVLIDTFFVRCVMVPSFVILLGKWNWWPSKKAMTDIPSASHNHTMG